MAPAGLSTLKRVEARTAPIQALQVTGSNGSIIVVAGAELATAASCKKRKMLLGSVAAGGCVGIVIDDAGPGPA